MTDSQWSIRNLLNPVTTRLLIYGMNPMDLEYVLQKIEETVILNSKSLNKKWAALWEKKGENYKAKALDALEKNHLTTARELFLITAQCYFAIYLVNPGNIEQKKQYYRKLVSSYYEGVRLYPQPVQKVEIPIDNDKKVSAYLHLPEDSLRKKGCVVFFAGLGSCKEEMNTIARTITERGISVLIPDMPGCGETLFEKEIKANGANLEKTFKGCIRFIRNHEKTKDCLIGSTGLCMGGGYAYRAAALNGEYSFCATLFPLFISQVKKENTPQWMKSGEWISYQTGGAEVDSFLEDMSRRKNEVINCPFFLIHGKYDNWMSLEDALKLYDLAQTDDKKTLIIEDKPVFSKDEKVLHAMPIGEQLHWIRHIFADWISDQVEKHS
ncbi:MAG: alpha/beta hydrolase [Spirochaetales bacterium]|nr:alpha/beta hydrolase [Spirochaetales bacterium]